MRNDFYTSSSQISGVSQNLRTEIKIPDKKIDNSIFNARLGLVYSEMILAAAIIASAVLKRMEKVFEPSVTIEDVENIVNAAISRHLAMAQGGK